MVQEASCAGRLLQDPACTLKPAGRINDRAELRTRPLKAKASLSQLCRGWFTCRLGVECCEEVKWLGWRSGHEYTHTLTIKNLASDVLHLSWRLPSSVLFVMEYPEPITLSPGMSYNLKVGLSWLCLALLDDVYTGTYYQTYCSDPSRL